LKFEKSGPASSGIARVRSIERNTEAVTALSVDGELL